MRHVNLRVFFASRYLAHRRGKSWSRQEPPDAACELAENHCAERQTNSTQTITWHDICILTFYWLLSVLICKFRCYSLFLWSLGFLQGPLRAPFNLVKFKLFILVWISIWSKYKSWGTLRGIPIGALQGPFSKGIRIGAPSEPFRQGIPLGSPSGYIKYMISYYIVLYYMLSVVCNLSRSRRWPWCGGSSTASKVALAADSQLSVKPVAPLCQCRAVHATCCCASTASNTALCEFQSSPY